MILIANNPSHPKPRTSKHNIVNTPICATFKFLMTVNTFFDARQKGVHVKIGGYILFVYVTTDCYPSLQGTRANPGSCQPC